MQEDKFTEHQFHDRPYWKNMKTCSECFKRHNEVIFNIPRAELNEEEEKALRSWEDSELHKASE